MTVDCNNCGNAVSDHFARVMGDNDGILHRCPACKDNPRELYDGTTGGRTRWK